MLALKIIISAIVAYLIGNIQTSILISKARHDDIREHGSGNAGSTNMVRVYGLKFGLLTFFCDFAKAFAAVAFARWVLPLIPAFGAVNDDLYAVYAAGFAVVLGHNFPVFFCFKGGKGVATSFGVVWAVFGMVCGDWITPVITTVLGIGMVVITGIVSVGSLIGALTEFVCTLVINFTHPVIDAGAILLAFLLFALLFLRHTKNIVRIVHGDEKKLFKSKTDIKNEDNINNSETHY